jgi:hypothetical protein
MAHGNRARIAKTLARAKKFLSATYQQRLRAELLAPGRIYPVEHLRGPLEWIHDIEPPAWWRRQPRPTAVAKLRRRIETAGELRARTDLGKIANWVRVEALERHLMDEPDNTVWKAPSIGRIETSRELRARGES